MNLRTTATIFASSIVFSYLPVPAAADEQPAGPSRITVDVGALRNRNGALGCRLFGDGHGFPEQSAGTRATASPTITRTR